MTATCTDDTGETSLSVSGGDRHGRPRGPRIESTSGGLPMLGLPGLIAETQFQA